MCNFSLDLSKKFSFYKYTTSVILEHLICYFVVGFFVWMGLFIWQSLEKSKRDSPGKYDQIYSATGPSD